MSKPVGPKSLSYAVKALLSNGAAWAPVSGQRHQNVRRTPPKASKGAAGLKNRLSTPGPFVTPSGGIPGPLIPVGSLKMPQVAYLVLNRLLIVAKISSCRATLYEVCSPTTRYPDMGPS